jgi:hypothetical protein
VSNRNAGKGFEVVYLVLVAVRDLERRASGQPRRDRELSFEGGFLYRAAEGVEGSSDASAPVREGRGRDLHGSARGEDVAIAERLGAELARWARLQNAS